MQNKPGNYFVFVVLIVYVMVATQAVKLINNYMNNLKLEPTIHMVISFGLLLALGGGLVVLNKVVQNWLSKKES